MKHLESVLATLFGLVFLYLSFAVAVETTMRKVFNQSLQGVDELGGYCLAVGAALAFTLALLSRAHIRIDLVHERLGRIPRAALNMLSGRHGLEQPAGLHIHEQHGANTLGDADKISAVCLGCGTRYFCTGDHGLRLARDLACCDRAHRRP
ncbi:MAG: TRAP transporter small permease subunit [Proteobacteria bacterium]|nr:TRAP transporter small permease subunit [Pseudomonadota bacterium]